MDWATLLSTSARLLDVHDSDHSIGASLNTPPENRPGIGDGMWLDVATRFIEFLYEKDLQTNEPWIPVSEIFDSLSSLYNLSKDDVIYVANYLATPTRIVTRAQADQSNVPEPQVHKSETALVEWPRSTKSKTRCRLTASGVRAVQFSKVAKKWVYAADDAGKLVTAIETNSFSDIPIIADSLIVQVRSFSKQITMLLERHDLDQLLDDFEQNHETYLKVMGDIQRSVEQARQSFRATQSQDSFDDWLESDTEGSPYAITQSFNDIMQSIERLNRRFQHLLSNLTTRERDVIGVVRFDEAAIGLAKFPCNDHLIESCLSIVGPWAVHAYAPLYSDFADSLNIKDQKLPSVKRSFDEATDEPSSAISDLFLETYRDDIAATLRAGPLTLDNAISKGWFKVNQLSTLSELIGLYVSPDWLESDLGAIEISVSPCTLSIQLDGESRLEGDNLILTLKPSKNTEG